MEIKKHSLRSEKVTYLMWGYFLVQVLTLLFINWFPEELFIKILLVAEEIMLVFSLVKEGQKVKQHNKLLENGQIKYGRIRPLMTKVETYERIRTIVKEIRVVCECEEKLYDGSVVICAVDKEVEFLDILNESEIPILIGEDMSYVALEELAEMHGVETDYYFAPWLCGWIWQPILIGLMIKVFLGA